MFCGVKEKIKLLRKQNDFNTNEAVEHIQYIRLACSRCIHNNSKEIGSNCGSFGFVEVFKRIFCIHWRENLFRLKSNQKVLDNMEILTDTLRKLSIVSKEICVKILEVHLHSDLVDYLRSPFIKVHLLHESSMLNFVILFLRIIRNVANVSADAKRALYECNVVDVLQRFCLDKLELVSCFAIITQSYIVDDGTVQVKNQMIIDILFDCLGEAVNGKSRYSVTFDVLEILKDINKLAANGASKELMLPADAKKLYAKLLQSDRLKEEQEEAARGLRILDFESRVDNGKTVTSKGGFSHFGIHNRYMSWNKLRETSSFV